MTDLDHELAAAFHDLAARTSHDPILAQRVRARARRGRLVRIAAGAVVVVALAATVTAAAVRTGRGGPERVAPASAPCRSTVVNGVLPVWARAGFSDPEPVMPHVTSAEGGIVAILWEPLLGPPAGPGGDKVLWVWRTPVEAGGTVEAVARLDGSGPAVRDFATDVTGPSGVSLPSPGCWRITISWPGGSDTVDLQAGSRPAT